MLPARKQTSGLYILLMDVVLLYVGTVGEEKANVILAAVS